MVGLSQRLLPQDITYWAKASDSNNEFEVNSFNTPIVIRGRWEDKIETIRTSNGDEYTSKARVFLDQQPSEGDYIALGDMTDKVSPLVDGIASYEVMAIAVIPDLRALSNEIRVYL